VKSLKDKSFKLGLYKEGMVITMNQKPADFHRITEELSRLGVRQGDILLVHSSLSSLGNVEEGAKTVVDALLHTVSSCGTLLMPALSYSTVNSANPIFSAAETPSCVGAISEYFRKREGTVRSLHPTHSVCANGLFADEFVREHWLDDTPVGSHSPLFLLAKRKGRILMLGCGLCPNTSMHGVEEISHPPYLMKKEKTSFKMIDSKKNIRYADHYCHDFTGFVQRYDRIEELLSETELNHGHVLNAECFLIDAAALWNKANQKLQEQPYFFVDKIAD
jgi:aminoglycoside 3-N-acetyltransferase